MADLLIVGGTGFVGRELCAQVLATGDQPIAFAPDADQAILPAGTHRLVGDITDPGSVRASLHDALDGIVHVASFGIGGEGLRASADLDRLTALEVNVRGFVVMAEAAVDKNVPRMVWASTAGVYGTRGPVDQRLDEDVPIHPDTFYGATKATCEVLAAPLFASCPERFTSIRLPTVYGAGRYPGAQAEFVRFVEDVANDLPAHLTASDYPIDWIHVEDAASVLLDVVRRTVPHHLYNVVGHTAGVASMGREAAKHATSDAIINKVPPPAAIPPLMDDSKARTALAFSPHYNMSSGMEQYVNAMRSSRSA